MLFRSEELPAAVARVQAEARDLRRTIKGLQERLAVLEADSLARRGTPVGRMTVVVEALEGWDAAGLKGLATAVAARPGYVAALFSTSAPALVALARSGDVQLDCGAVLRTLVERFGGRGGGKPDLAQGGGLNGTAEEIVAAARDAVRAGFTREAASSSSPS